MQNDVQVKIGDFVEGKSVVSSDVPVRGVVNGVFTPELVSVAQGINSRLCQDPRIIPITKLSKETNYDTVNLSYPQRRLYDLTS